MGKITLSGHITAPADDVDEIRSALLHHIELTRAEPGCLVFRVEELDDQEGCFRVYEEFVDRHAFELHQERVKNSDWGEVSRAAQRDYEVVEADA